MAKWAKGESGNPGGGPAGFGKIRDIARQHTDAAIETLVKVMGNDSASHSAHLLVLASGLEPPTY